MSTKPPVLCLMGPTASGKTGLAMEWAANYPCQIISVDSAMIYQGMDIGTAKPSLEEQKKAPHRLIDICSPVEAYSVGRFYHDVIVAIEAVRQQGDVPLLVGGTMQYFHRLQQGIADLPPADPQIRQQLEEQAKLQGWPAMHVLLASLDPKSAARIHPNDSQRIQRALEIIQTTGYSMSDRLEKSSSTSVGYQFTNIVLWPDDRAVLHQTIASRFDTMLHQGLVEEVEQLSQMEGFTEQLPSIRSVGYRQVWDYLCGHYDQAAMREKAIVATRQLAKRQLTWLRSWQQVNYIKVDQPNYRHHAKACVELFFSQM